MKTVGLLMGIYNEAERIEECLQYHLPFVDEAVIVVQESEDGTGKIVEDYLRVHSKIPYKVLHFPKMGCSEATLQDGADALNTDWILYVDADEKFPQNFLKDMHAFVENTQYDGIWFRRDNWFDVPIFNENVPIEPKRLTIQHPKADNQMRLTRKSMTIFPRQVHMRARVLGEGDKENLGSVSDAIYHLKKLEEQNIDNNAYAPAVKIVNATEMTKHGEMIDLPFVETDGTLVFAEAQKHIPFDIKRVFYIYGVPQDKSRGGHANRELHEVVVCLKGSVKITLERRKSAVAKIMDTSEFILNDPTKGLFIPRMSWITLEDFSEDTILLVFASTNYEPVDYIKDHDEFLKEVSK